MKMERDLWHFNIDNNTVWFQLYLVEALLYDDLGDLDYNCVDQRLEVEVIIAR